jgi:signal transduction histidine kinase
LSADYSCDVETLGERQLRRLIEVGRALVSELDLEVLLRRVIDVARELTGARYVALGILDSEKNELERFLTAGVDDETRRAIGDLPRGRGVLGLLIHEPKPLRLAEVGHHPESYGFPPGHPAMHSFLGVPVLIRGEAYGNLYLTEKEGGREFTDEDEHAVVVLADWAAIAIENARLYQSAEQRRTELERAVRRLEVTTSIARAVGGETDLDRVLELIVKRARALVDATSLWILLAEGGGLTVAAAAGAVSYDYVGTRLEYDDRAFRSDQPERIADVAARGLAFPDLLGLEARSALIVPLGFRGNQLGMLIAFDRVVDGPEFNRDDEELLRSFAASAATAVHTARSVAAERLERALEAAEQERGRWARELHDETLQGIGSLQMLLAAAVRETDADKREAVLRQANEQVREEVGRLRNLIVELRPAELDELGLPAALEALADRRAAANGIAVAVDIALGTADDGAPRRLAGQIESTIYRIAQEALSNAGKHADASRVELQLVASDEYVELTVRDDGAGFDPETPASGFGLVGMRERVALVRGELVINSVPGGGTTVRASFPASTAASTVAPAAAPARVDA